MTRRVNRLWSSYHWLGDERDVTNGTPSPLSDRLSPMCAIGEQIESEFGLMTLNTVQPLDYIALAEGGRNRHWSTTLSFGPPILRRPFTLTYSHQPCINLHDSPYFCIHPYVHESRLPQTLNVDPTTAQICPSALRLPRLPKLRRGHDPVQETTVLCPLADHHTTDLEVTRRMVRFVWVLPIICHR